MRTIQMISQPPEFQLKSSSLLSTNVCRSCQNNLIDFTNLKQQLVSKQARLYQLLEQFEEQNVLGHDIRPIKTEPEAAIKIETFDITEDFNAYSQFYESEIHEHTEPAKTIVRNKKLSRKDIKVATKQEPSKDFGKSCPFCQKYFERKCKLKIHVERVHEKIKNFECDLCDYRASLKYEIRIHLQRHHSEVSLPPISVLVCPTCGKSYRVSWNL
jgi:RNase P subunit RPR2